MQTFPMPVRLIGAMSFKNKEGQVISTLYTINSDPENEIYAGLIPAKMSCDESVFPKIPKNSRFPIDVTLQVRNKTSGGKTVQHAVDIVIDKKAG